MAALWDNFLWLDNNIFHMTFGKYLNIHRHWTILVLKHYFLFNRNRNIQVCTESEKKSSKPPLSMNAVFTSERSQKKAIYKLTTTRTVEWAFPHRKMTLNRIVVSGAGPGVCVRGALKMTNSFWWRNCCWWAFSLSVEGVGLAFFLSQRETWNPWWRGTGLTDAF